MAYQPVAIVQGSDIYLKCSGTYNSVSGIRDNLIGIENAQSGIRTHASGQRFNQANPDKNVWYETDTFNLFDNRYLTIGAITDASSGAEVQMLFSGVAGWETYLSGTLVANQFKEIANTSYVLEKVKARGKVLSSGATFLRIYIAAGN
jgi:hypothetical protein